MFHTGRIPGVVVHDDLLALVERKATGADRGRAFFVDLAAKHVALARRTGFDGVYLGGHAPAEAFRSILDQSRDYDSADIAMLARELHYLFPDEFYLFEADPATGLSTSTPTASYLESRRARRTELPVPVRYRLSRRLHDSVFADGAPLFSRGRKLYEQLERKPALERAAHLLEQAGKVPMFGCRDCGDCSLPEIAYVCPESQCAKNQRNGPCGGTRDGLCEVYDSECIWSQAYERLKAYGEEEEMLDNEVVVKDNQLARTSAWKNAFLGRDHNAGSAQPPTGGDA